jgi:transcriptional regulator with XRE-family HTH domain
MRLTLAAQAGKLVRAKRDAADLTTRELAERCGFTEGSYITKIEQGRGATLDNLAVIARALNIELKELIP